MKNLTYFMSIMDYANQKLDFHTVKDTRSNPHLLYAWLVLQNIECIFYNTG